MQLFLNMLFFNGWLPNMKKERNEGRGGKSLGPLRSLVTFAGEGGACNSGGREVQLGLPVSCLHLCDQKQQSVTPLHRALIFGGQAPFCPPWL